MDRVRSGLRHDIHHARGKSSELRTVAICDDTEFLHGIRIWKGVSSVAESRGVIAAVQVITDRPGSAGRTIHHANLGRASQWVCRIRLIHAWCECEKCVKIPIHERQREDFLVVDGATHAGVRRIHQGRVSRNRNSFSNSSNFHDGIHASVAVHFEHNSNLTEFFKTGDAGFHAICSQRESSQDILSRFICHNCSCEVGFLLRHLDFNAGHYSASRVGDRSKDGRGCDLREQRTRKEQYWAQQCPWESKKDPSFHSVFFPFDTSSFVSGTEDWWVLKSSTSFSKKVAIPRPCCALTNRKMEFFTSSSTKAGRMSSCM